MIFLSTGLEIFGAVGRIAARSDSPGEMSNVFNEQRLIAQVAHRVVAGIPECVEDLALGDLFLHLRYSRGLRGGDGGEAVRRHAPSAYV